MFLVVFLKSSGTNEDKAKSSRKHDLRVGEYDGIFPHNFKRITPITSSAAAYKE